MVFERTVHRYALCVYITHPISGQRHFSCRYSDPASSNCGGHVLQESRGDRWCPRCGSVVNEVVLVRNTAAPSSSLPWPHHTKYIHTKDTSILWTLATNCVGRIERVAARFLTVYMRNKYVSTEYVLKLSSWEGDTLSFVTQLAHHRPHQDYPTTRPP